MATPREIVAEHGWDVVYVPHEEIWQYNACYRVELDGLALWRDNPRWRVMNAEWDEGRKHLPFPHED